MSCGIEPANLHVQQREDWWRRQLFQTDCRGRWVRGLAFARATNTGDERDASLRTILDDLMQVPTSRDWLQLHQLPPPPTLTLLGMQILQAQYRRTLQASRPTEITWREWRKELCTMVITGRGAHLRHWRGLVRLACAV